MLSVPLHPPALLRQMRQDLQVVTNLPVLVRHRRAQFPVAIQYSQAAQPVVRRFVQQCATSLVMCTRRRLFRGRLVADEPRVTVLLRDELPVRLGGAEQSAVVVLLKLLSQPGRGIARGNVSGLIARRVTKRER